MACYYPITAYQRRDGSVVFAERGEVIRSLALPCSRCVGCRLERSRQWSVRCLHEAKLWPRNSFVTLTYEDDRPSLYYRDFQDFMKRLRRARAPERVRFFMSGEYGDQLARPHYHALLFNVDFPDKSRWSGADGSVLYRSVELEKLWPLGYSTVGEVTVQSAGYVARYCFKKVTGDLASSHYRYVDEDGVIDQRVPEFARMSLRPGIGEGWIRKWKGDVSRKGLVVVDGVEVKVPRYYEKFFDQDFADDVAQSRYVWSLMAPAERSDARLRVREEVTKARLALKKRRIH